MAHPTLLQFRSSHYNEKARWVLDYKGIPHVRRTLLPGFHARSVRKLTGRTACLRPAGPPLGRRAMLKACNARLRRAALPP